MSYTNENRFEDLLSELTDALLNDASARQINTLVDGYEVAAVEVNPFKELIYQLQGVLEPQQPSDQFVKRLKRDLTGQQRYTFMDRLRYLPARVHVAAGVAVVAGFMLITRRRLGVNIKDAVEIPALQQ